MEVVGNCQNISKMTFLKGGLDGFSYFIFYSEASLIIVNLYAWLSIQHVDIIVFCPVAYDNYI